MAPGTPNLIRDIIRIHKVVTRSLEVCLNHGKQYLTTDMSQPERLQGYSSYTHCFTSVLSSHHQAEDLITFPAFKSVIPSAPYERFTADHHEIERLLTFIPQAVSELTTMEPENGLKIITNTLSKISEIWYPHIQLEEHHFTEEVINKAFNPEEQGNISAAASKLSQEHTGPPYWIIPFILFNLEHEERASMAASFPPMITEELIPKVWKDQWAPMKPYFLD